MRDPSATDLSRTGTAHHVQLFDSDESLAETVADFLGEGFALNETLLAVMDEHRWYPVAMRLSGRGLPVDEALQSGQLIVRTAAQTLKRLMPDERPDPAQFAASVGNLVSDLSRRGRRLRIYGEMVDVLASRGEYAAAEELENLWNELATREPFTLLCGYGAANFGDPRRADALRRICASHGGVLASPQDLLGSFLVREHRPC